jgi:hypothetical protein
MPFQSQQDVRAVEAASLVAQHAKEVYGLEGSPSEDTPRPPLTPGSFLVDYAVYSQGDYDRLLALQRAGLEGYSVLVDTNKISIVAKKGLRSMLDRLQGDPLIFVTRYNALGGDTLPTIPEAASTSPVRYNSDGSRVSTPRTYGGEGTLEALPGFQTHQEFSFGSAVDQMKVEDEIEDSDNPTSGRTKASRSYFPEESSGLTPLPGSLSRVGKLTPLGAATTVLVAPAVLPLAMAAAPVALAAGPVVKLVKKLTKVPHLQWFDGELASKR